MHSIFKMLSASSSFFSDNREISLENVLSSYKKEYKSGKYDGNGMIEIDGISNWWGDGKGSPHVDTGGKRLGTRQDPSNSFW